MTEVPSVLAVGHRNHPDCPYSTKKVCEQARREAMGKCAAMTDSGEECLNWAIDRVDERGYCGQHLSSVSLRKDREMRAARKKEELDMRIATYLDWQVEHPSVWDRMRT